MTEQTATTPPNPLPEPAAPAQPKLIHSGLYTLWETPDKGILLVFKRLHTRDDVTGKVLDIHAPKDERLPHVPPEALPLVSMWLDNGFPESILAMLRAGKVNPAAVLGLLRGLGGLAAPAVDDASAPGWPGTAERAEYDASQGGADGAS